MSLLTMFQNIAVRAVIVSPSFVIGNTDPNIVHLLGIANEEGQDLAQRYSWNKLIKEATFVSVAVESQGSMDTIAADFKSISNETVWNRTLNRRITPLDDVQWQQVKSSGITGPQELFRIRGGEFLVIPTMTAGETVAFEYKSKNWCKSSGGAEQSQWLADTDVGILDEEIMELGLLWRWKHYKGVDYAESFNKYEQRIANATSSDGSKKRVNFGDSMRSRFINKHDVPEGNFPL